MIQSEEKKVYIIQPDYYSEFICAASACTDTCCKGWGIEVDPETLEKWKETPCTVQDTYHSHGCRLSEHVTETEYGSQDVKYRISMNERQECPLLTKDGLCSVVLNHGDGAIPKICQDYPRQSNEYEAMQQKSLSVRCASVLDILWKKKKFQYVIEENHRSSGKKNFPVRELLDGILWIGNHTEISSREFLMILFEAIYQMHRKMESLIPCDETGYRDYGQELLTEETIREVIKNMKKHLKMVNSFVLPEERMRESERCSCEERIRPHHDMMYDVMQSFFDDPVFGPEFTERFYQSKKLLEESEERISMLPLAGKFFSADADQKMKLLILEELFTAVLSIEVLEYETILVRLQWLTVKYLVIRYLLLLDHCMGKNIDEERMKDRISRIFRVTELPDILKIAFFDMGFKNWLWTPEYLQKLLLWEC